MIIAGSVSDDEAKKIYPARLEGAEALYSHRAAAEGLVSGAASRGAPNGELPKTADARLRDCVIFDPEGRVLLIRRGQPPYAGAYALPGGFVEIGETVEAACRRERLEETGIEVGALRLVGVYSDPARDPRGHTVSVAYGTELPARRAPGGLRCCRRRMGRGLAERRARLRSRADPGRP